ncbi:MAG: cyclic nucleotide-binding domain-containing protein [Rhodothermales bacterium]|nr:cyclic nucleotide-binding domain-containing protein [Rhodothermales bacterium]
MSLVSTISQRARTIAKSIFRQQEDERLRQLADLLAELPLFNPLPRGMLVQLAEAFHSRSYKKDEFLYYEGDPGIGLYVIQSGTVRLLVEDENGQAQEVREIGPSDMLGATCLLGGGIIKRTESAQAVVPTEVLGLFSPEFRTLQRRHPKTGAAVATLLARHFAQRLVGTRRILAERDGPYAAAEVLGTATAEAAQHADPPPGW